MDAKRVLAALRQFEFQCGCFHPHETIPCSTPHKAGCELAALLAEVEHEAQTGGWKPGTEPPDSNRLIEVGYEIITGMRRDYGRYVNQRWKLGGLTMNSTCIRCWRDLPPLPEEKP